MNTGFKINLGSEVKCKVTGFKGIVRGRSEYMTGCNTYGVQSQKLKDNRPDKWEWFDEDQLIVLKDKKLVLVQKETESIKRKTGGPHEEDQFAPEKS